MPTVIIPDKICSHCGGNEWYCNLVVYKKKGTSWISRKCVKKAKEDNIRRDKANPERRNRRSKKYRDNNKEKRKLTVKNWVKNNPEKAKKITKKYQQTEKYRKLSNKYHKRARTELRPYIVKALLKKEIALNGVTINSKEIPDNLVILKKKQLCLKRIILLKKSA